MRRPQPSAVRARLSEAAGLYLRLGADGQLEVEVSALMTAPRIERALKRLTQRRDEVTRRLIRESVDRLPLEQREQFHDRAMIGQVHRGLSLAEAERAAYAAVVSAMRRRAGSSPRDSSPRDSRGEVAS